MTNTATISTSNKHTNNCGKIRYILNAEEKIKQTQQSKTNANLNFSRGGWGEVAGVGGGGGEERERINPFSTYPLLFFIFIHRER